MKTFEEYKYFRAKSIKNNNWGFETNLKDPNEPFFNKDKKNYKDHKHLLYVFRTEDRVNDFLEIKRKLKENNIISEIKPYYGDRWVGWNMNEYIHIIFDLTHKYTDEIIYSPIGADHLAMREIDEIPKLNSKFNVENIVKSILNFTEKKKVFDFEMKGSDEMHLDIDPYGEENWNGKQEEVEKAKRDESEFWEWMADQ